MRSSVTTETTYIPWPEAMKLIYSLIEDNNKKYALIVSFGVYAGMRIGDILSLKYKDISYRGSVREFIYVKEKKTKKVRKIMINSNLKGFIEFFLTGAIINPDHYLFRKGRVNKPMDRQTVNQQLKRSFIRYGIKYSGNVSSHCLRKTFGRRVWDLDNNSDKALVLLSKIFNHSSVEITRRYLGIQQDEIDDVYTLL
jgi:integrase